jgi:hypothetical protein
MKRRIEIEKCATHFSFGERAREGLGGEKRVERMSGSPFLRKSEKRENVEKKFKERKSHAVRTGSRAQ